MHETPPNRPVGDAPAGLRVRVLGRFAASAGGRELPPDVWKRRRAAELLGVLAALGGDLPRERVVEILWPDKDRDAGANNLHRAVHDLRQVVGEFVQLEKGRVRLDPAVRTDVGDFESALTAGDLAAAIALYVGDLDAVDGLEARRAELHRRFVDASLEQTRRRSAAGDDGEAVTTLRNLLAIDPACEDGHVALVRSLARLGREDEARRQVEACAEATGRPSPRAASALRPAASAPGPETFARIARRLLGSAAPPPIRGRDAALADVAAFVSAGGGTLVLLGEAGVGKTRLAVEAARLAEGAGAVLLAGAAMEVTAASPFGPFLDAWAQHLRSTGRPPGENPFATFKPNPVGHMQDDKHRLFQSVERDLLAMGAGRPVCFLLDDIHLADESSLHLLRWLARAARSQPLLLVATCREEEVRRATPLHALLADLHRDRTARRLALDRLDRQATRALLADLLGDAPDDVRVREVYRLAEGNPFYVEEVARAGSDVSAELSDTVRARVSRAGEDVERLLVAACVLGPRFDLGVAQSVAEMPDALVALERAVDARLVEEAEGAIRFRHALVHEALVGTLTRARRVQLHRRAAAALAGGDPAEIAFHHLAGDEPEKALPHLVTAGRRAAGTTGLREAVGFFEQADAVLRTVGGDRYPLLLGLGQMRIALSELDLAMGNLDDAAAIASTPEMRANALRLGSLAAVTGGELVRADTFLVQARAAISDESPALPNVLYQTAQLRWHESRYQEAYALSEQCLAVAEKHGDQDALAKGYEMLALACHSLGSWREGVASEKRRQEVVGHAVDVASMFDVHL